MTPGGLPNQLGVVYNHNSSATPMSNISNQLMLHQQHVSQFEVPNMDGSVLKADCDSQNRSQGDTIMNLLCILGRAYQL